MTKADLNIRRLEDKHDAVLGGSNLKTTSLRRDYK